MSFGIKEDRYAAEEEAQAIGGFAGGLGQTASTDSKKPHLAESQA